MYLHTHNELKVAELGTRTVCTAVNDGNTVKITFWDPPHIIGADKLGMELSNMYHFYIMLIMRHFMVIGVPHISVFPAETGHVYKFMDVKFGNQQFRGTCLASVDSTMSTVVKVTT